MSQHESFLRARRDVSRRRLMQVAGAAAGAAALTLGVPGSRGLAQGAAPEATPGASPVAGGNLTIYCGRSEELIGALVPRIEAATGIALDVRFGNTAELAAQILEEGDNTPAGLFFGQDAGSLGALARQGRLAELPDTILNQVDERFRSPDGLWIGLSGRARVLVYNPETTDVATLPASIIDLPATELGGPIGWAPTNASFQSFVTALRVTAGEDEARAWLAGIIATEPVTFDGNAPQIDAVANGEIAVGLVNHYYLYQARKETPDIAAENYYFPDGDIGSLINVAGAGVLAGSGQEAQALDVTQYLLGTEAQTYFATETSEYPLVAGVEAGTDLPPLEDIDTPDIDLSDLDGLDETLTLLTELGLI
jgi:iron(III) transport system substrate-binding protein